MRHRKEARSWRTRTSTFGTVGLAAALLSGCDGVWSDRANDCKLTLMCEEYRGLWDRDPSAVGCVPSETNDAVSDSCGVFVAASGNDGSAGTKAEPVKTLAEALRRARETGSDVYACAEPFGESVEVPAGVALFGGLDCESGWTWIGAQTKTTVAPEADAIPLTLARGEGTTRLEDIEARAHDALAKGGSSIAVLADGATAELARCALVAGNAADGDDGDDAPSVAPERAPAGSNGVDACSDLDAVEGPDATLRGGALVENACDGGVLSIGGAGGDGNVNTGSDGATSQGTAETARGGLGEPVNGAWDCAGNEPNGGGDFGVSGIAGEPGVGASGNGTLSRSGYTGVPGGDGTPGTPGQGGGGGGGAKGGRLCTGGVSGAGASGGSGGAGGCGGLAGGGGRPGGASIALASVDASVTLIGCTLTAGRGGNGGKGGDLQPGGLGGNGGAGGVGVGGTNPGCAGGQGGKGGNGGPGGGGLGGPSLAIAFRGTPVVQQGQTSLTPGAPGTGGPGGSNNITDNAGADGATAGEQELR
ncbi:PGRS family protein [Sorangium sp. So ce124]|uniref:PGRS family protein n=1 Tax=Sorangium sp. So ce124 TaxID=3133280 RepID=UPI003F6350BA